LRPAVARSSGPTYDALALQNEYASRWLGLAGQAVRHWRLRTELGDDAEFDAKTLPPPPVSGEPLSRILAIEEKLRESRRLEYEREAEFLERAAGLAEEEIASLAEQLKIEEQGVLDDQAEYKRAKDLLAKGKLTNTRVADARRSVLYSSTRKLQTANSLMQARRRLSEYLRDLERMEDRRRISVFEELQVTELKLAEERTRLRGVEEKLNVTGIAVPGLVEASGAADITLIRRAADGLRAIRAGYDDEVLPGDVVEVVWHQRGAVAATDIRVQISELRQEPPRTD
jgi:polysaccharide export outer membrane protein